MKELNLLAVCLGTLGAISVCATIVVFINRQEIWGYTGLVGLVLLSFAYIARRSAKGE